MCSLSFTLTQTLFHYLFSHTHTSTTSMPLWSVCVTEQVLVSWLLLSFPCCNTIRVLLCVCVCVCACVCKNVNAHAGVLLQPLVHIQVCVCVCVWSSKPTITHTGLRWKAFVPAAQFVSSYHNRYRSEPPILTVSRTQHSKAPVGGLGVNFTPPGIFSTTKVCSSKKQHLLDRWYKLKTDTIPINNAKVWSHLWQPHLVPSWRSSGGWVCK